MRHSESLEGQRAHVDPLVPVEADMGPGRAYTNEVLEGSRARCYGLSVMNFELSDVQRDIQKLCREVPSGGERNMNMCVSVPVITPRRRRTQGIG